ncbi:hypothetical protein P167DRAFT_545543 [Morchella conica CCBAS932]|uniref:Uncharacterized protein n=1 Tax=Morchella conica CCBAS932 TaxID=1392247 RepID=A0A3N4KS27_9PEZI|nr:hypothetical protein P167DRAFT_545543 [Morchella conica CCBAS932]
MHSEGFQSSGNIKQSPNTAILFFLHIIKAHSLLSPLPMAPTPPATNGLTPTRTYPHSSHPIHATLRTFPPLPIAPPPLLHAPPPRFHRRHYITLGEEFENARNTSHQQANSTGPSHQYANHTAHHQFPQALANVSTTSEPQPTKENDPEESFGRAGMFRYGRAPYARSLTRRGERDLSATQIELQAAEACVAAQNGEARQDQHRSQEEEEGEEDESFEAWCKAHGLLPEGMEEKDGGF